MEHLEDGLEEVEQAYDDFYSATCRAANYAQNTHGYRGQMFETIDPELLGERGPDEEAGIAYKWSAELEDEMFKLSGDIQAFIDEKEEYPERVNQIDIRLAQIREMKRELENELEIIIGEKIPEEDIETWDIQHRHVKAKALKKEAGL